MTEQTVIQFLEKRLQEDEDAARDAARAAENGFNTEPAWEYDDDEVIAAGGRGIVTGPWGIEPEIARHIERHQPARVLREVAAKRAILELADEASGWDMQVDNDRRVGPRDMDEEPYVGDLIIRHLAAAYSDHPDYREEWRP